MFNKWADKLRKACGNDGGNVLALQLKEYPPLSLPFPGPAMSLSEEQASSNLRYVLEAIPERQSALRSLLTQTNQAIHWPDDFTQPNIDPFVNALHKWAGEQWPTLRQSIPGDVQARWLEGERSGDSIAFSLVTDVALTLGELIRAHRPSLQWGVDLDPRNRADIMNTVNRVMLLGNWRKDPSRQIEIDIEATVVNRLLNPGDSSERYENTWLRLVRAAIDGGYEGDSVVDEIPE